MSVGFVVMSMALTVGAEAPLERIHQIIDAEMARQRIPGVALAVVRGGDVLSARGYGLADVEHGVPVTDETIFQSGSIGKQFTAAAVMLLVEAGRLSLDDPLTRFFPEAPEGWSRITVRNLLTHTSGIPDYTDGRVDYRKDYTEDDLARLAFELPADFPPGHDWKYSNTGYVLLGAIVRRAGGHFYGDLLRQRVFAPLGMTTARVISESDIVTHRASGYRLEMGEVKNQEWVSPSLNTTADGSLYLSLRDLVAWDRGVRARAVLSSRSWDQIFEPVRLTSGRRYAYGFGWVVDRVGGQAVQEHGGAWQGFTSHIARYLGDDLTVIVLTNLAQAQPGRIAHRIAEVFIPSLGAPESWVITGAMVADGTGAPLRSASLRFEGGVIRDVGGPAPRPDERVLDATGMVLAPGFIDAHNHSTEGLDEDPDAVSQVAQGITTMLLGQDGDSPWPISAYLERRRATHAAANIALLVGHETVRLQVMGEDFRRPARRSEIVRMERLVDRGMRDGAYGLSSGLEYEAGSYATTDELVALARVVARHGGFYISHIRDEADRALEAIAEAIAIGERARVPVQITHIKLGTVGVWGKAAEAVALIDAARRRGIDVTADCYPYVAWQSNLKVLVPNKRWDDAASVQEALDDVGGGENIMLTELPASPRYVGMTLADIARTEGASEAEIYMRLVKDAGAEIIGHTMREEDMRVFLLQPWTMISSDGGIGITHPRGAGAFPRVLGRLVRESGWLTLPEAIRKMTSLPASRLKLTDRGVIRPGMKADLVLFDPAFVVDRSTFTSPHLRPNGIKKVWVNGGLVWDGDHPGGERPGEVLVPERARHQRARGDLAPK